MDRDQPPAVNDSAVRGVPGVCRMLAGAEMQKAPAIKPGLYKLNIACISITRRYMPNASAILMVFDNFSCGTTTKRMHVTMVNS